MAFMNMTVQIIFTSGQKPLLRVLILNHQWLMGAAIASLLGMESDLEICGLTATSVSALLEITDRFSLDVIIVDNFTSSDDEIRHLCIMFSSHPRVHVFVVRYDANVVNLDGMGPVTIAQASDLAMLIRRSHGQSNGCIQNSTASSH